MSSLLITTLIIFAVLIFVWLIYNKLVNNKNMILEAWGALDVTLKKRHELVPNLIAVVKNISQHEKELFTEITKWRAKAMGASDSTEKINAENNLSSLLGKINVVIENYPNLISGDNFLKLQDQLMEIEDEISYARRYYNGTVRNNNILIESFPSNLVANIFNFREKDYFEIETSTERSVPTINFKNEE